MPQPNITLTSNGKSKILERSKLHKMNEAEIVEESGSLRAIVLLVVVIIIVAAGGTFLVKNIQNRNATNTTDEIAEIDDPNETDDQVVTPIEESPMELLAKKVVNTDVLSDELLGEELNAEDFVMIDSVLGSENTEEYTLQKLTVQPYNSVNRVIFTFSTINAEAQNLVPLTEINYRNLNQEVEVVFKNVLNDLSGFNINDSIFVNNSSLLSVVKDLSLDARPEDMEVVYRLKFNDTTGYKAVIKDNQFIIDIQEVEKRETTEVVEDDLMMEETEEATVTEEASVTPTVTTEATTTPTTSPTTTPKPTTVVSGTSKTEIESKGEKGIITGYTYEDYSSKFIYYLKLSDNNIPSVKSSVSGDSIVFEIANLEFDALPVDGVGHTDFAANGVKDIKTLDIKNDGTKSVYTFNLSEKKDYNVYLDDKNYNENRIVIEFVH